MIPLHSYDDNNIHFHVVDEHAKRASAADAASYESLVAYLREPLSNSANEELLLARALMVWLCHQQSSDLSGAAYDSPRGLVQQMRDKNIEHSRVFKVMCGYAGIECEIVQGRAKAIRYQAGDGDSNYIQGHTWNAFKTEGQWRLMHPQWCIQAYVGYVHGGEIVIESEAKHDFRQTVQRDGTTMYMLNDFWFSTNPEIFATRCLPNDSKWQCLPHDKVVRSVNDFLSLPDLRQGFYRQKLSLLLPKTCSILASHGKCYINILAPKNQGKEMKFSYELLAVNVCNLDVTKIPLLVLFIPNNPPDTFNFEVSFPAAGQYRLKIRVGVKGQTDLMNCCEFKIDCSAADPNCRKLPVDTGIQGWGYGPDAEEAGLKRPSTSGAKIPVNTTVKAQKGKLLPIVEFSVDADAVDDKVYTADIYKSSDSQDNKEPAVVNIDRAKRKMSVQAANQNSLTHSALVVSCRDKADPAARAKPVANYMLTSEKDQDDRRAEEEMSKELKQARNQEKLTRSLERRSLLTTEKQNKEKAIQELLKKIADNEACD